MSKEDILLFCCYGMRGTGKSYYEKCKEIERLNNIINKAIEFIYKNAYDEERKKCIDDLWGEIPKLLDILKGE